MKDKFIFDVDGTLTPSRGIIDTHFKMFFNTFCLENDVYLVTGSDKPKTIEQLGEDTYNLCKRVYNCSGGDVYEGKQNIRSSDWKLPDMARTFLISCEYESLFDLRTGNHIEERSGLVNFSVVGRNANAEERAKYVEYDSFEEERNTIANSFNIMFPELNQCVITTIMKFVGFYNINNMFSNLMKKPRISYDITTYIKPSNYYEWDIFFEENEMIQKL